MIRLHLSALALLLSLLSFPAFGNEDDITTLTTYLADIEARFTPGKPTVVMCYDVHYRFLTFNLMRVAEATIEATEGFWLDPDDGSTVPCCKIDITLRSPSAARKETRSGPMYINSRMVSVVTMPELETLYYLKLTDELLNPMIGAKKDIRNFHVYDLTGGGFEFFAHDLVKGESTTNIAGATDMASQGREVSRVLLLLSDIYHERCGQITPDGDFRIFVNCDGKAVPFAARSARDRVDAFGGEYSALKVDVMPAREAPRGIRTRDFSVWTTSFMEVAGRTTNEVLRRVAAEAPAWGMTPLLADYGMAIGQIRCSLVELKTHDNGSDWAID